MAKKAAKKKASTTTSKKSGTPAQKRKVAKVMHEFKEGDLHSGGDGQVVKDRDQAVAIAMSEAGLARKTKKAPAKKSASAKTTSAKTTSAKTTSAKSKKKASKRTSARQSSAAPH